MLEEILGIPSNTEKYSCITESILMGNITAWYGNSTEQDRKALQRVVHSAEHTIGIALPCLKGIYTIRCKNKSKRIIKNPNHPGNSHVSLLQSKRRYQIHQAITERFRMNG